MKFLKDNKLFVMLASFFAALLIVLYIFINMFYTFTIGNQQKLNNLSLDFATKATAQNTLIFTNKINNIKDVIENIKFAVSVAGNDNELEAVLARPNYPEFDSLGVIFTNGKFVGRNVSEAVALKSLDNSGKDTDVGFYVDANNSNEQYLKFSSTVNSKEQYATIIATIPIKIFENELDFIRSSGSSYVINSDGYVITCIGENVEGVYNLFKNDKYDSVQLSAIEQDIKSNISHTLTYDDDKVGLHANYLPVNVNDWYYVNIPSTDITVDDRWYTVGLCIWLSICLVAIFTLIGTYIYITQRNMKDELIKLKYIDTLTGCNNAKKFMLLAKPLLKKASIDYAVISIDVNKFKILNDLYGYESGDKFIVKMAEILTENFKEGNDEVFGRNIAENFFILMKFRDREEIIARLTAITKQIKYEFLEDTKLKYTALFCAGIFIVDKNDKSSIDIFIDKATIARDEIMQQHSDMFSFYNFNARNKLVTEKDIENKMDNSLKNDEFIVFFQPKYSISTNKIVGAEALVRWKNMTHKNQYIFPSVFIPMFERNGFIVKLDMYIFEKACETIKYWIDNDIEPVKVSINFSRLHLENEYFIDEIVAIANRIGVPHKYIELELTESAICESQQKIEALIARLHSLGLSLSLDDFGSGYSALGLLKNINMDVIKLDRSFFIDYNDLERAISVVRSMVSLAQGLGITVVAEGIETSEQLSFLRDTGCDIVQGYIFARPMPNKDFNELLVKSQREFKSIV